MLITVFSNEIVCYFDAYCESGSYFHYLYYSSFFLPTITISFVWYRSFCGFSMSHLNDIDNIDFFHHRIKSFGWVSNSFSIEIVCCDFHRAQSIHFTVSWFYVFFVSILLFLFFLFFLLLSLLRSTFICLFCYLFSSFYWWHSSIMIMCHISFCWKFVLIYWTMLRDQFSTVYYTL